MHSIRIQNQTKVLKQWRSHCDPPFGKTELFGDGGMESSTGPPEPCLELNTLARRATSVIYMCEDACFAIMGLLTLWRSSGRTGSDGKSVVGRSRLAKKLASAVW